MNRQDLVAALAKRAGLTRVRAAELVDLLFGEEGLIAAELRRGGHFLEIVEPVLDAELDFLHRLLFGHRKEGPEEVVPGADEGEDADGDEDRA